jgi:tRNA-guanine family transglycosylase
LNLKNALYSLHRLQKHKAPEFLLFASVQAWDKRSARIIIEQLAGYPFHGYALGGMVPRTSSPNLIFEIIKGIREVDPIKPLHVFGIGSPHLVKELFHRGIDSVDSSSFIQNGVAGRIISSDGKYSAKSVPQSDSSTNDTPITTGEVANLTAVLRNLQSSLRYCL